MAHVDTQYNKLVKTVLTDGFLYQDKSRGNIEMLQISNYNLIIDIDKGFPLLTTKKIFWKLIAHELIWMLSGAENIKYLQKNNVNIWNKDAANFDKKNGFNVGRIYGAQWRKWQGLSAQIYTSNLYIDQITNLITGLKNEFYNRKHIVTAWNPAELNNMALPPCHWAFEILPTKTGFNLKWHQRSCDLFLGIPFDIGLYAFLGKLIEHEIKRPFENLIGDLSNIHFYKPHIELVKEQLKRKPLKNKAILTLACTASILNINISDFFINNYFFYPAIKAELYSKII